MNLSKLTTLPLTATVTPLECFRISQYFNVPFEDTKNALGKIYGIPTTSYIRIMEMPTAKRRGFADTNMGYLLFDGLIFYDAESDLMSNRERRFCLAGVMIDDLLHIEDVLDDYENEQQYIYTDLRNLSEEYNIIRSINADLNNIGNELHQALKKLPYYRSFNPEEFKKNVHSFKNMKVLEATRTSFILEVKNVSCGNDIEGHIKYKKIILYGNTRLLNFNRIEYHFNRFTIVSDIAKGIAPRATLHPHVHEHNTFCYGNKKTEMKEYIAYGAYPLAFDLIWESLNNYSADNNPFSSVTDIKNHLQAFNAFVDETERKKVETNANWTMDDYSQQLQSITYELASRCTLCGRFLDTETGDCYGEECRNNPGASIPCDQCGAEQIPSRRGDGTYTWECPDCTICDECGTVVGVNDYIRHSSMLILSFLEERLQETIPMFLGECRDNRCCHNSSNTNNRHVCNCGHAGYSIATLIYPYENEDRWLYRTMPIFACSSVSCGAAMTLPEHQYQITSNVPLTPSCPNCGRRMEAQWEVDAGDWGTERNPYSSLDMPGEDSDVQEQLYVTIGAFIENYIDEHGEDIRHLAVRGFKCNNILRRSHDTSCYSLRLREVIVYDRDERHILYRVTEPTERLSLRGAYLNRFSLAGLMRDTTTELFMNATVNGEEYNIETDPSLLVFTEDNAVDVETSIANIITAFNRKYNESKGVFLIPDLDGLVNVLAGEIHHSKWRHEFPLMDEELLTNIIRRYNEQ